MPGLLVFISEIMPMLLKLGNQLFGDTKGDAEKAREMLKQTEAHWKKNSTSLRSQMDDAVNRFDD